MLNWAVAGFLVVLLLAVLYWQFVIAEGAYLGPRAVILLYDWAARSYDRIKEVDPVNEAFYLAEPIMDRIGHIAHPLVLDVATGTGRLYLALLNQLGFDGHVVGLDLSAKMLRQAQGQTARYGEHVDLVNGRAGVLPFPQATFDAVTCLEALEFMPDPPHAIAEMVRVLRPGGLLLVSNRVGWEARFLWGRWCGRGNMEKLLASYPLHDIQTYRWQTHYDLLWATKEGEAT